MDSMGIPLEPNVSVSSTSVGVFLFAATPLLYRLWLLYNEDKRQLPRSMLKARNHMQLEVLAPGLVILRNALCMELQLLLAQDIFEYGHQKRKWWELTKVNKQDRWMLNNHRQGRGRIYDALHSYPGADGLLRQVCLDSVALARSLDPAMPAMDCPTHLLVLYYTTNRKLGWHRDNGLYCAAMVLLSCLLACLIDWHDFSDDCRCSFFRIARRPKRVPRGICFARKLLRLPVPRRKQEGCYLQGCAEVGRHPAVRGAKPPHAALGGAPSPGLVSAAPAGPAPPHAGWRGRGHGRHLLAAPHAQQLPP
jgi:hypothetical protein